MHSFSDLQDRTETGCCRKTKNHPAVELMEAIVFTTFSFAMLSVSCIFGNSTGAFVSATAFVLCLSHAVALKTMLANTEVLEPSDSDLDTSNEDEDEDEDAEDEDQVEGELVAGEGAEGDILENDDEANEGNEANEGAVDCACSDSPASMHETIDEFKKVVSQTSDRLEAVSAALEVKAMNYQNAVNNADLAAEEYKRVAKEYSEIEAIIQEVAEEYRMKSKQAKEAIEAAQAAKAADQAAADADAEGWADVVDKRDYDVD